MTLFICVKWSNKFVPFVMGKGGAPPPSEDQFRENILTFSCRNRKRKSRSKSKLKRKSAPFAPRTGVNCEIDSESHIIFSLTSFSSMKVPRRTINLLLCCMFSRRRYNDKY